MELARRLCVAGGATLALMLGLPGCGGGPTAPTITRSPITPTTHLDELLTVMQARAANSGRVDWVQARADVHAAAAGAKTIQDTYSAIRLALQLLDDYESFYLGANRTLIGPSPEPGCRPGISEVPSLPASIAYVRLEGCPCGDEAAITRYATALQQSIREADRPGLVGWIVDLREDRGGNMWPMIAGLGPIFGETIIGWIVHNNRDYEREYRNGAALSLDYPFASVADPYTLLQPSPRVAVLTAETTNSAGEAITVFFRNRPNTRSFGAATCGHHHLLEDFYLANGDQLTLKYAHNADRTKRTYAGPVVPDVVATQPGEAVARALEWLLSADNQRQP